MDNMKEFKDLYLQTARDRIQALNDLLLKLEKQPEELELVEELMRTGHSLKGESAAMGYEQIATLAHVVEDLFTAIGNQEMKITTEIIDELLNSLDRISASIDAIESSNQEMDLSDITNTIKEMTGLTTEGFGKSDQSKPKVDTDSPKPAAKSATSEVASQDKTEHKAKQISSVTLKIEKLDQMISVSEELVLLKMKLKNNDIIQQDSELKAEVHRLDRLVTDMQFHVMQARLFPISLALHTIPRLVRDTAKKTNKNVRLEMEGQETTVDRTIIDHLTEPYVHMIRNAVDHGIEDQGKRKQLGKPEEAVIKIKAYTRENKFITEISDDGKGIEWGILAKKAVKEGIFSQEEVDSWTEQEKQQLLFIDGVSASEEVTDVSGRGVGLGAVQKAIKKLGGKISVTTKVGAGTTFTLTMPMTLAIMQALLVKIRKQTFAMPSNSVIRSIQINTNTIQSSANVDAIVVDGGQVPLIHLDEKFCLISNDQINKHLKAHTGNDPEQADPQPDVPADNQTVNIAEMNLAQPDTPPESPSGTSSPPTTASTQPLKDDQSDNLTLASKFKTVVLVRQDENIIGCMVDKIVAEEEILVKPLGPLLKQSNFFSGATILADGSAAPIINFEGFRWKQAKK